MRIAIVSDSHDQIANLHRAVMLANAERAEILIHCGDLISPFMLNRLHLFQGEVHLIYGNNIGDLHLISSRCETIFGNITHHGIQGSIVADGLHIGFTHYPDLARGLAFTGTYDVICCGHNHLAAVEQINSCLLINPGDLLGKDSIPGFAILDTSDMSTMQINAGEPIIIEDEQPPVFQPQNKLSTTPTKL